jgi:excisionase family DNA binding protein
MQVKPAPRFLTSLEVAAACGVSARTVSNWIRDGAIPAHRTVGGHGRVSADDLRRFLVDRRMPVPPDLAGVAPQASARARVPREPEPAPRRKRILVIDDDETLLDVMKELLGASGYEVEIARHGFLAGYLVGHCRPDVIVLDIMMPGLDGYEVLSLMRRRPEARTVPVVACTSLKGAETEARIRGSGFDAYVRKPVDFRVLLQTLGELADRNPAGGDPGGRPLPA